MIDELVSIITPCYNGARFISETIESVLSQTYQNWEMIIVDDGSTDNSADIIRKYVDNSNKIKLVRQDNSGAAAARNNGIRIANGRYIALLDSDDVWYPDFLEKQIKLLSEKNTVCVCSAYNRIDELSNHIGHTTFPKEIIRIRDMNVMNQIGCLTGLYDSKKYGKIYLKEELKSIRDDYAYWYDIVKLEDCAYGNQEPLADYRVFSASTTGNKRKLIKKQYWFYRNYLHQNVFISFVNLCRWGISGLIKFSN